MGNKISFENALKGLKDAVCDLTSLEVQTYTGDLTAAIDGTAGTLDLDGILDKTKGNLKLACATRLNFDGDGIVVLSKDPVPEHVTMAHEAAVKAGQEVRTNLLTLFGDLTGLKVST